jgi:hypothetical protein
MRELALGLVLVACGEEDAAPAAPASFDAAWAEFMTPAEIGAQLPLLREREVAVNVAWHASAIDDPARIGLVRDGESAGVRINPWLLLSEEDGYWPGSTNAALYDAAARELMDAWSAAGLAPTTLLVDMELPFAQAQELTTLLTSEPVDLAGVVALFEANIDRTQFADATAIYAALADEAHARGWRVALTTLPQMLDDHEDGDDDLRQAFTIPVDGIEWDSLTFQAYRTLFGDLVASMDVAPPTAYFVYRYAQKARELYGDKGGVDVGLVGSGVTDSTVYAGPHQLAEDVAAAMAAGAPRAAIQVYNLDGMFERGDAEAWLAEVAPAAPPPEDQATAELVETDAALDGILDE